MATAAPGQGATIDDAPHTSGRDRTLAWALILVALACDIGGLVTGIAGSDYASSMQATPIGTIGASAFALVTLAVGVILRFRRPDHGLGWTFLWLAVVAGLSMLVWGIVVLSDAPSADPVAGRWIAWVGAILTIPTFTYVMVAIVLRFPSGAPAGPDERRLLRWLPAPLILSAALGAFRPGPLLVFPAFDNPIEVPAAWSGLITAASSLSILAGLAVALLAVRAKVDLYRRASNIERHQLRWFAFAAAITVAGSIVYIVIGVILAPERVVVREGSYAIFIFAACSLPIAVLIAISRYRLYEIDRIVGRTVAYGALTAILAGIYAAGIRSFNALFVALTGEESEAALVLTTLVLTTTFTPIKGWLEKLAAKRFPSEVPPASTMGVASPPSAAEPATDPSGASAGALRDPAPDLDARIEVIARRVAHEVLRDAASPAERRVRRTTD